MKKTLSALALATFMIGVVSGCSQNPPKTDVSEPVPQSAEATKPTPIDVPKASVPIASTSTHVEKPASQPVAALKPEVYHDLDPAKAGFDLKFLAKYEQMDSHTGSIIVMEGVRVEVVRLKRGRQGKPYAVSLVSDTIHDGKVPTTLFGEIQISLPPYASTASRLVIRMTDTQRQKIESFLDSKISSKKR